MTPSKPSFFIFSLPRSGTSWLSVFLSGFDSFCYHEPTADHTVKEWAERAVLRVETVIGAIDTAAYLWANRVREALPKAKFFVLDRNANDVQNSVDRLGMDKVDWAAQQEKLLALPFPRIHYARLHDLGYLRAVYEDCVGHGFDLTRAKQLSEMRVQRDHYKFFANRPRLQDQVQRNLA